MVMPIALVGSNCYGLALPDSDTDILCLCDEVDAKRHSGKNHYLLKTTEELVTGLTLQSQDPYCLQWLFPARFLTDSPLSAFLLENREQLVTDRAVFIWELLWNNAMDLSLYAEHYYGAFPKRMAYSIMRLDTLSRFGRGASFASAFVPEEPLREQLLAIRRKELPFQDALHLWQAAKAQAEVVHGFYECHQGSAFQSRFASELWSILR